MAVRHRIAYKYWHQQGEALHVSLESVRPSGADETIILSDDRLDDFAWVSSDRLVYSQKAESSAGDYSAEQLWDLRLDPRKRTEKGSPRRLADFSGFMVTGLNATADGKHLLFLRGSRHHSVFAADLTDGGDGIINARMPVG